MLSDPRGRYTPDNPWLLIFVLVFFCLSGCQWSDWSDWHQTYDDFDGDGYDSFAAGGKDCDDEEIAINPGANELCDGIDSDCDGLSDDEDAADTKLWSEDADEDGFGKEADITAC
ncbi:MAG: hypothetical protein HN348_31130, partial [Proteobacteria bacterium]|nr:hypothetical protein [Pseudomonadota bacterium]